MAKLSHAILIEGGNAEARRARAFDLLREHFSDDPSAARKFDIGVFEDLIVLEPDEGKDITVGMAEDLIGMFKQKPFASTGRACIIPYGERMNEQAQNKLLKLLEEPAAGNVILILTGNAQRLLATVRSRMMRVWLGYAEPERGAVTDDLRTLVAALIYDRGTIPEANSILSRYEGSREEASEFIRAFQVFLRELSVGRMSPGLIYDAAGNGKWLAEAAVKIQEKHAARMRKSVIIAEKALTDIDRGDRIRYVLRRMALSIRNTVIREKH